MAATSKSSGLGQGSASQQMWAGFGPLFVSLSQDNADEADDAGSVRGSGRRGYRDPGPRSEVRWWYAVAVAEGQAQVLRGA